MCLCSSILALAGMLCACSLLFLLFLLLLLLVPADDMNLDGLKSRCRMAAMRVDKRPHSAAHVTCNPSIQGSGGRSRVADVQACMPRTSCSLRRWLGTWL